MSSSSSAATATTTSAATARPLPSPPHAPVVRPGIFARLSAKLTKPKLPLPPKGRPGAPTTSTALTMIPLSSPKVAATAATAAASPTVNVNDVNEAENQVPSSPSHSSSITIEVGVDTTSTAAQSPSNHSLSPSVPVLVPASSAVPAAPAAAATAPASHQSNHSVGNSYYLQATATPQQPIPTLQPIPTQVPMTPLSPTSPNEAYEFSILPSSPMSTQSMLNGDDHFSDIQSDAEVASSADIHKHKQPNFIKRYYNGLSSNGQKHVRWISIAMIIMTSLILIISLSVSLSGSSSTAGLSEADQKRLSEATALIDSFRQSLRANSDASIDFDSGTIVFDDATLSAAGFTLSEISNMTSNFALAGFSLSTPLILETQPVFCTIDADCQSIDPDATCSSTQKMCWCVMLGVSGFQCEYGAPSFVDNNSNMTCDGSSIIDSSLLEYDYNSNGVDGAWTHMLGGFPTRKHMEATQFWSPDSQETADDIIGVEAVDQYDISYMFYASTTLYGVHVKATIWLYVPSIKQFDGMTKGIAIRFSVASNGMSLRSIPALSSQMGSNGTSWLDAFSVLNTSAIVVASEAWNINGFEVVKGINIRLSLTVGAGRSSSLISGWNKLISNGFTSFDMRAYIPFGSTTGELPSFEIALEPNAYLLLPSPANDWLTINRMEAKVIGTTNSITTMLSSAISIATPEYSSSNKKVCVRSTGIASFTATATATYNLEFILDGYDWSIPYVSDVMNIHRVASRVNVVKDTTSFSWSFDATLQTTLKSVANAPIVHTIIGVEPPTFGFVMDITTNSISPSSIICSMTSCPSVVYSALNQVNLRNVGVQVSVVAGGPAMELANIIIPNGVRIYTATAIVIPTAITTTFNQLRLGINNQSSIVMGVQVPFTDPTDTSIFVRYENIINTQLSTAPVFQFNFAAIAIRPLDSAIEVAGGFALNLKGNPGLLYFSCAVALQVGTSGGVTVTVQGVMAGTWVNAFTVPGLDISNVVASIGMTIPPTGIPVPSSIGAQGNFSIGSTYLFFAMNVNPAARQFYIAAQTPKLGLVDLIAFVVKTTNAPVNMNLISTLGTIFSPLSVEGVDILIAPLAYTQPDTGVVIPQGFKIKGKFNFLLVSVDIDMELAQRTVTWWPSPINTFKFSLGVSTSGLTSIFANANFVTTVMRSVANTLNQFTRIDWGGWSYIGNIVGAGSFSIDWSGVVNDMTSWLPNAWVVAGVSLTDVDLVGMVDKTAPVNPTVKFTVTLPGRTMTWSHTIDVNFFVNQQAAAASAFITTLGNNVGDAAKGVIRNFCSRLKVCHTFEFLDLFSERVCIDIGGSLGLC